MAGANRVNTHFLEDLELAFECSSVDSGTQCTKIVVHADPFEIDVLSVEEKSFFIIELDRTNTKNRRVRIDDLSLLRNLDHRLVKIWRLRVPERGLIDPYRLFGRLP